MSSRDSRSDNEPLDPIVAEFRRNKALEERSYRARALKLLPHVCAHCGREFEGRRLRCRRADGRCFGSETEDRRPATAFRRPRRPAQEEEGRPVTVLGEDGGWTDPEPVNLGPPVNTSTAFDVRR